MSMSQPALLNIAWALSCRVRKFVCRYNNFIGKKNTKRKLTTFWHFKFLWISCLWTLISSLLRTVTKRQLHSVSQWPLAFPSCPLHGTLRPMLRILIMQWVSNGRKYFIYWLFTYNSRFRYMLLMIMFSNS